LGRKKHPADGYRLTHLAVFIKEKALTNVKEEE
jgi:hypothetical protein